AVMAHGFVSALFFVLVSSTFCQGSECPRQDDIAPCECENNGGYLFLDCSQVADEEELARVFKAEFPTATINELHLIDNRGIKILENGIFGNISFGAVMIIGGVLETIEGEAFQNSQQTLAWMRIYYVFSLSSFQLDGTFEHMILFEMESTNLTDFLMLNCPKMEKLRLVNNGFIVPQDPFTHMPLLKTVEVSYLGGMKLPDILFTEIHTALTEVYITMEDVINLQVGPFQNVSVETDIKLDFSDDSFTMQEGALNGLESMKLELWLTATPTLEESIWRPLLNSDVTLVLNEITCDCNIKWLVSNSQFINQIQYRGGLSDYEHPAKCSTGENLADLDPADFENC
ncbi:unnamed protein product, partial [Meganyctiphanes norvegica]